MTLLTSVGLLVAVAAATYGFCVRPMRRGSHPISQATRRTLGTGHAGGAVTEMDARLASAREEVARLRERARLPAPVANTPTSSVGGRDVLWVCTAFAEPLTLERSAPPPRGAGVTGWRRHVPVNMSRAERVARVAAGLLIAGLTGLVVPGAVVGAWGAALVVLGWLAVVDLVVSGLTGHCPLHRFVRLPWDPRAGR